jgi:hypothetical protein
MSEEQIDMKIGATGEFLSDSILKIAKGDGTIMVLLTTITGHYRKYRTVKSTPPNEVYFTREDIVKKTFTSEKDVSRKIKALEDAGIIYSCIRRSNGVNKVHFQLLDKQIIEDYKLYWLSGIPEEKKDNSVYYGDVTAYLRYDYAVGFQVKQSLSTASYGFIWLATQLMLRTHEDARLITYAEFPAINSWFKGNYEFGTKPKYNYAWLKKAIPDIWKQMYANKGKDKQPSFLSLLKKWHIANKYEVPFHNFAQAYEDYMGKPFVPPVVTSIDDYADAKMVI